MRKKKYMFPYFIISISVLLPIKSHAITASDYSSRNMCSSRYELAEAKSNYTLNKIACYNDYDSAKKAMDSSNNNELVILDSTSSVTKIVNAKYALLDLSVNPELLTYFYESPSLNTRQYTYMDTGSLYGGVDGALLDVNYGKSIKVMIGGLSAWIKDGTYEIVPLNWVKSSSSYTITDSIKHNYVNKIQNEYNGNRGSVIGPKPEQLPKGNYYSYDGHYFYKDRLTMLKDYKNGNRNNSVNKDNPYYNYYMFLTTHSKTTYSSRNIDEYIRNNMNFKYSSYSDILQESASKLYGQGIFFYNAQEKHGVNSILSLSLSRNESANGTSSIVIAKNNGFGLKAYDSNPSQNAGWYPTFASSVYEFAYHWVTDGYADPSDKRYFGPAFGDKSIGMNVCYAADTYWSEKMAANYYSFDKSKALQDYNYYQLGVVNRPINAYISPTSMSQVVYKYPEQYDSVLIVGEVTNAEGTWYKLQSDKIINGGVITTLGDYNWNSYVYVKKDDVTKINKAKNGYKYPKDVTEYNDSKYSYDLYIENATLKPKVAITNNDTEYFFDSTLEQKTGKRLLKDKWVMVYAEAKNEDGKTVSYLVTSDYKKDQKHWIPAGKMKFQTTGYGLTKVTNKGYFTWVNSNTEDSKNTLISGLYTNTYVPLISATEANGYVWYQVPVSLDSNNNSIGWTISNGPDAAFEFNVYNADNDNKKLNIQTNTPPTISASNKEIIQGDKINLRDGVEANDKEDGNLTSKIEVTGEVDINKVGTYKIKYTVKDSSDAKAEKEITITVKENQKPVIKANDKILTIKEKFDPKKDVEATDREDGNLTSKIEITGEVDTNKIGEYVVIYKVKDSYNQEVEKKIKVTVVKNHEPVINAKDLKVYQNEEFDPKKDVSVTDKEDGDLTKKLEVVENTVDTKKLGKYIVKYKVKDSYGNEVEKQINIEVVEKKLIEKDGIFNINYLKENDKYLELQAYQTIKGIDNNLSTNINYEIIFKNIETDQETKFKAERITIEKSIPKKVYSPDGKDYNYSWFNLKIDVDKLPIGNYKMYVIASNDEYYSKSLINNKSYNKQATKVEGNNHSAIISNNYDSSISFIELRVREKQLAEKTSSYIYNQFEKYTKFEFKENLLYLKGNSYSYGMDLSKNKSVDRKIIFENKNTYKTYIKDLKTLDSGNYTVVLPVSDNLSKDKAWYEASLDISDIPKGEYIIYISTKSNITDISEMKEKLSRSLSGVTRTIKDKKYSFTINNKRGNRIEMIVE